jgi:hypothetical protein
MSGPSLAVAWDGVTLDEERSAALLMQLVRLNQSAQIPVNWQRDHLYTLTFGPTVRHTFSVNYNVASDGKTLSVTHPDGTCGCLHRLISGLNTGAASNDDG